MVIYHVIPLLHLITNNMKVNWAVIFEIHTPYERFKFGLFHLKSVYLYLKSSGASKLYKYINWLMHRTFLHKILILCCGFDQNVALKKILFKLDAAKDADQLKRGLLFRFFLCTHASFCLKERTSKNMKWRMLYMVMISLFCFFYFIIYVFVFCFFPSCSLFRFYLVSKLS